MGKKDYLISNEAISILAVNVRSYRLKAGLTQTELAELVGVSYSQIARIELAEINTSVSMVYLIGKALKIKPHLLLMDLN